MRKTFHEELKELKKEVLKTGNLVGKAIDSSVKALVKNDLELADKVIAGDDRIDEATTALEEEAMAVLARQSPVARDLRLIYSVLYIGVHLERMGDLSLNIAQIVKKLPKEPRVKSLLNYITEMGLLTRDLIKSSLEAFDKKDLKLAQKLPSMDEPIDNLFKKFFKELARLSTDEASFDWATNMVLINRYLERIADHAVDIGERVAYMVTGEMKELD